MNEKRLEEALKKIRAFEKRIRESGVQKIEIILTPEAQRDERRRGFEDARRGLDPARGNDSYIEGWWYGASD